MGISFVLVCLLERVSEKPLAERAEAERVTAMQSSSRSFCSRGCSIPVTSPAWSWGAVEEGLFPVGGGPWGLVC